MLSIEESTALTPRGSQNCRPQNSVPCPVTKVRPVASNHNPEHVCYAVQRVQERFRT